MIEQFLKEYKELNIQWELVVTIFLIVGMFTKVEGKKDILRIIGFTILIYSGIKCINDIYTGKLPDNTKELEYYAH